MVNIFEYLLCTSFLKTDKYPLQQGVCISRGSQIIKYVLCQMVLSTIEKKHGRGRDLQFYFVLSKYFTKIYNVGLISAV